MIVYASVFLLILFPLVRYDICGKKGYEDIWYYVLLIALIAIAAFRYRTGGDTLIYMSMFEDYPTIGELTSFDYISAEFNPMWYVYNSIFKSFGNSFLLFQIVQAIFVNSVIFWFLRKYCNWFYIAVLLYYFGFYFYYNMEILREILCICIFLLSFESLIDRNYLKYYLIAFFAISIHVSAVLLLFLPLFLKLEKERLWLSLGVGLCAAIFLSVVDVVGIVLSTFLGDSGNIIRGYLSLDEPNLMGKISSFIVCLPFLIFFHVRKKTDIKNNKEIGALLNIIVLIQCVGMFIQGPTRFSNYLMLIGMVFLVNTTFDNLDKIKHSQITTSLVLFGWFVYLFNLSHFYTKTTYDEDGVHNYDIFIPYVSVFNPHEVEKREKMIINDRYDKIFIHHREP